MLRLLLPEQAQWSGHPLGLGLVVEEINPLNFLTIMLFVRMEQVVCTDNRSCLASDQFHLIKQEVHCVPSKKSKELWNKA